MYSPSPSVEERAFKSLSVAEDENRKKRLRGEDKMIRALAISENELTCLVTPRTTFSGEVCIEWNNCQDTRMTGSLSTAPGSPSQHLSVPSGPEFTSAVQNAAAHGPVPIKVFCEYPSSMQKVKEAMMQGLEAKTSLLGDLFCNTNRHYTSRCILPPNIMEGNPCQHQAYKVLRERKVALVQGFPGAGKTRLMIEILKSCQHLRATVLAETNDTCEMLAQKALEAGLAPVLLPAKGRGSPKNTRLHGITAKALAKDYNYCLNSLIKHTNLLIVTNTLATTNEIVLKGRDNHLLMLDESGKWKIAHTPWRSSINLPITGMIPAYRFAGLRLLRTTHLLVCGDPLQNPPYKEKRGEFAHLLNSHPLLQVKLSIQYRMHPQISKLCNALAYGGDMEDGQPKAPPLPANLPSFLRHRLVLVDTKATKCLHRSVGNSSMNTTHIEATIALYRLLRLSYPLQSIQALSLYEAHANELATVMIPCFREAPHPLSIAQAQGSEFPVVILNIVKTKECRGFPENLNVINVGVSRAMLQMFIIADSQGLLEIPMWSNLRPIWYDEERRGQRKACKDKNLGKKRVKFGEIFNTALSDPYITWMGPKSQRSIPY